MAAVCARRSCWLFGVFSLSAGVLDHASSSYSYVSDSQRVRGRVFYVTFAVPRGTVLAQNQIRPSRVSAETR